MARAVALFSGGLDSQLAVKLMLDQGVEVEALTSASVFHHHTAEEGDRHPAVVAAGRLGVPITLLDTDREMLRLVRQPHFGRGKRMNPCIDCRIFLLRKAAEQLRQVEADFLVTGEVVGQRPMSQRREALARIEREAGVEGLVLRPLCARLLPLSVPEQKGWVDRGKLKAIRGRSRKEQIALAEDLGITEYPSPAGGCLLTDPGFAERLRELLEHGEPALHDVRLLRLGRHFRLGPKTKVVMGRFEEENHQLERLARGRDVLLDAADFTGPTALLRGRITHHHVAAAAGLTLRYGKCRDEAKGRVILRKAKTEKQTEVRVPPASDEQAAELLISMEKP
jgi:tRNA U34 2-thiouridine synthase MnmA/TrmU